MSARRPSFSGFLEDMSSQVQVAALGLRMCPAFVGPPDPLDINHVLDEWHGLILTQAGNGAIHELARTVTLRGHTVESLVDTRVNAGAKLPDDYLPIAATDGQLTIVSWFPSCTLSKSYTAEVTHLFLDKAIPSAQPSRDDSRCLLLRYLY